MANLDLKIENRNFRQLLGNGISYKIPEFQRDYSWTINELEDLWLDILSMLDEGGESGHYMGYIVLQLTGNKKFTIIDGQQRITSITLLVLAAIKNLYRIAEAGIDSENNKKRAEQLRNSYIGFIDITTLIQYPKLELNRHNNYYYQNNIVPLRLMSLTRKNSSEELLGQAFDWFYTQLEAKFGNDWHALMLFIDGSKDGQEGVTDKLHFTVMNVTNELNAYNVFETLNSRGVRLSTTDLLKNYLFSIVDKHGAHISEFELLEDTWGKVVSTLGSESLPVYLRSYWNSKNKLIRANDLFKTIKKEICNKLEVFELVRAMDSNAVVFSAIQNPAVFKWDKEELVYLTTILKFNIGQHIPLLLAAFNMLFANNRKDFDKILRYITVISFRYNVICNRQTHEQEVIYNKIAMGLSAGTITSAAEVLVMLKPLYLDDKIFGDAFARASFDTYNSKNRKLVRYILLELEKQLSGNEYDFESDNYSIEHIWPQNYQGQSEEYPREARELINRLGNMTLLDATENRDLSNELYCQKKDVYAQSRFQITNSIPVHYHQWNTAKLESRQEQMAKLATAIWKLTF
ncbi:MAG: DUF262 domain-containing protein [Sedimentisphaerales bacterium]|nr:DUF262 domain-containing protein [Sedimentisphaerales bacterium]MBN2841841.1 DUF262 domain-containing protein [Sedimentisphaerales bacterium]